MKSITKAKKRIQSCLGLQSETLDLSDCKLTTLDDIPELLDCVHLSTLKLSYNQLTEIQLVKNL